jgi:hypothetical protein
MANRCLRKRQDSNARMLVNSVHASNRRRREKKKKKKPKHRETAANHDLPCKYIKTMKKNSMKQKMYRGSNCIHLINLTKQTIFSNRINGKKAKKKNKIYF